MFRVFFFLDILFYYDAGDAGESRGLKSDAGEFGSLHDWAGTTRDRGRASYGREWEHSGGSVPDGTDRTRRRDRYWLGDLD
jgi:hypothetical protein